MPPPTTAMHDDPERLRAVAAYAPARDDADLDRFAAVAADLFGLPVALVNLLGDEHAVISGRHGLDLESLPRDLAFCYRTIQSDAVLTIPDLTQDAGFAVNPLVAGAPGFRFYAGAPLRSRLGGERIGAMCVLGFEARAPLDAREARLLENLAELAMDRLECRRVENVRRLNEERLRHLAYDDALTGCANHVRLAELIEASRHREAAALVLLDLGGHRQVADLPGHAVGDDVLRELGGRLTTALGQRGTLARPGGDGFAAWLPGCVDQAQAEAVARDLLAALALPLAASGRSLRVASSAGVALAGPGDAGTLLADAAFALGRARAAGRGTQRTYDTVMRGGRESELALTEEVRQAALSGQFELHYQPQVDLRKGSLVGAEALLRWRHPERGVLPPAVFLPALKSGPMAGTVGDWIIEEGCRQAADWRAQGLNLRVGINLFAEQIRVGTLEATVLAALDRWGLPPEMLELELTETIALSRDNALLTPLHALRAQGVGLALDDFGTGFASLSTLKSCPLTRLKIDRSFVSGLGSAGVLGKGRDRDDVAIIEAVLALAHGLDLRVVAEGVETEAQSLFLAARGCDEGQGYLYSPAVPPDLLPRLPLLARSTPEVPHLAAKVIAWADERLRISAMWLGRGNDRR